MANNCKLVKDLKCRHCNAQGDIQSAGGQGRATEESGGGNDTLALEYQQPQIAEYAQANVASAALAQSGNSWPTPPMLL